MEEINVKRNPGEMHQPQHPLPAEHTPKFDMEKLLIYAMIVVVSVVLLFSIVQTVQINSMQKESVGLVSVGTPGSAGSSSTPRASQPAAPTMVGGC